MISPAYFPVLDVFDYADVTLVPQECVVKSRSEVDTSVEFGPFTWDMPVIPANMSTIVDEFTCDWLARHGLFYVMHRFDVDNVAFIETMKSEGLPSSISVGVKQADYDEVLRMRAANASPDYVTIDIAHGDSETVRDMIRHIRINLPSAFIIAGNIATAEAAIRLAEAGADAVKVGIGPGSVCLTSPNTGFGTRGWQLSAVENVAEIMKKISVKIGRKVYVIADGGIRTPGDIAKAIAFGADMVMVGGMLAGHDENPGSIIETDEGMFKEFFGSASAEQKGESKHVEGKRELMPYKGSLADTVESLRQNLQSSISYSGGKNLLSLRGVPHVRV